MIGKIIILGLGATSLAVLAQRAGLFEGNERGARARKELGEQFRRIPLPHLKIVLPATWDDLAQLDDALCECVSTSGAAADMNEVALLEVGPEIQKCTAALLFPEIDWPPVHSDHPSIHQYWAIIDQRYRRLVLEGDIVPLCLEGPPPPEVTAIDPRSVVAGTKPLMTLTGTFTPQTTVDFRQQDGRRLTTQIHSNNLTSMQLVVDANEPGSYDLVVSNGPSPASSVHYQGALVVQSQQE